MLDKLKAAAAASHLRAALQHLQSAKNLTEGCADKRTSGTIDVAFQLADAAAAKLSKQAGDQEASVRSVGNLVDRIASEPLPEVLERLGPASDPQADEDALFSRLVMDLCLEHGWGVHTGQTVHEWLIAELDRRTDGRALAEEVCSLQMRLDSMRASSENLNDVVTRQARAAFMGQCAEMLVADGNAPNIDCGIDMAGTVIHALRRKGIEIGAVLTAFGKETG